MIIYVLYKSHSITPCKLVNRCKLVDIQGGDIKRTLCLRLVQASTGLFYFNCNFFQRYKIIPTLLGDYLSSGGDINDL